MILQRGYVRRVEGALAWVECDRRTMCRVCASGAGCGGGYLSALRASRPHFVRARCQHRDPPPQLGDRVSVGLTDQSLLRAAVLAYLLPLMTMLLAVLAAAALPLHGTGGEIASGAAAAVGLGGGLFVARRGARRLAADPHRQAVLLRRTSRP